LPLPGIERRTGRKKRIVGEATQAVFALAVALLDLSELREMLRVRTAIHRWLPRARFERDVADPERDG
jgi:hypothetical protein